MTNPVRPDFVPASDYISRDFLALENERVWPQVWLMACREEELAKPGSYHVFNVVRESILLRSGSYTIRRFLLRRKRKKRPTGFSPWGIFGAVSGRRVGASAGSKRTAVAARVRARLL